MFRNIMKTLFIGSIIIVALYSATLIDQRNIDKANTEISKVVKEKMEYAYYEGQKDALEGDIRIEKLSTGKWVPIKSVWNEEN